MEEVIRQAEKAAKSKRILEVPCIALHDPLGDEEERRQEKEKQYAKSKSGKGKKRAKGGGGRRRP